MHRDANLGKRNALVIPGLLLATYSFIGILYAAGVRADTPECGDGRFVELFYGCRDAALVLAIPLVLGIVLLIVGMAAFRSTSTCRLGLGTWPTAVLVLLASLALIPFLAAAAVYALEDPDVPSTILSGETEYRLYRLLALAGGVGVLILLPFLSLYVGQARPNRCCREASCFNPCFCDETIDVPLAAAPASFAAPEREPEPMPAPIPPLPPPSNEPLAPAWRAPLAPSRAPMTPSAALQQWPPTPADDWAAKPASGSAAAKPAPTGTKTRKVRKSAPKKPARK